MNVNADYNWGTFIAVMFFLASICYMFIVMSTHMFNTRSKVRRDYFITSFTLFIFSFFTGVMTVADNTSLIHIYWGIAFFALCMFAPSWLFFLTNFIKFKHRVYKILVRATLPTSALFGLLCVFFGDVSFVHDRFGIQFNYSSGVVFTAFFMYMTLVVTGILIVHIIWFNQTTLKRYRKQVLILIGLSIIAAPIVYITEYFIPTYTSLTMTPLGAFAILPATLFVFSTMRRYKLFGITISNVSEYTFTSVTIPIFVLDNENKICLENNAAVECLGASSIGKDISDYVFISERTPSKLFFNRSFSGKTVMVNAVSGFRICDMALTVESDQYNDAICKIVVLKDITDINEALIQINDQNNKLTSLNEMAIIFLSQTDDAFEDKMSAGIKLIADEVEFDKFSVWRNYAKADGEFTSQIYTWKRYEGGTVAPEPEFEEAFLADIASDWDKIMSGEVVVNGPVKEVDDPVFSNTFSRYGTISAFVSPVIVGDDSWGFAMFEDFHNERAFDNKAVEAMRSAAYLSANIVIHKEMERKLEFALHDATEASKAKSEFLAKMSHEIRTPMNAILGMTELILREKTSDFVHEHTTTIKQAGANLLSIINDILDFSKIETGNMQIQLAEYSFASLINDVVNIIRTRVSDSGLQFVVNLDSNLPNTLIGDDVRIRQSLINVLGNAVKYTDEGCIYFTVTSEPSDDIRYTNIIMSIEDTGLGISEEDIAHLFTEYYQTSTGQVIGAEGVGLGLAITSSIISAMNGDISVESELGEGSTFTIKIPQEVRGPERLASVDNPSTKKSLIFGCSDIYTKSLIYTINNLGVKCESVTGFEIFRKLMEKESYAFVFISRKEFEDKKDSVLELCINSQIVILSDLGETAPVGYWINLTMPIHAISVANVMNGITDKTMAAPDDKSVSMFSAPEANVLVVDDISTNLRVVNGLLMPYKMTVDLRLSGKEAIEAVKAKHYDLVFMDHRMPDMDGVETTERIRALGDEDSYYKNLPIIALTANAVSGMREMFLQNGFNEFMSKPIDTVLLNSVLETWIPQEKQSDYSVVGRSVRIADDVDEITIDGLDIKKGLGQSGGTIDYFFETLASFISDGAERRDAILECLNEGNLTLYVTLVHAIKGATANIGAVDISKLAFELENAGIAGDWGFIKENNDSFLEVFDQLLDNVKDALSQYDEKRKSDVVSEDSDKLIKGLHTLEAALDSIDIDVINGTVDYLLGLVKSADGKDIMRKISHHILMFEYDEAKSLIARLLESLK